MARKAAIRIAAIAIAVIGLLLVVVRGAFAPSPDSGSVDLVQVDAPPTALAIEPWSTARSPDEPDSPLSATRRTAPEPWDPVAVRGYAQWNQARGYFDGELQVGGDGVLEVVPWKDPYHGFDESQLRELAVLGEAKAQLMLADRILMRPQRLLPAARLEEATRWLREASAHGYTRSLERLMQVEVDLSRGMGSRDPAWSRSQHRIEAHAYALVSERRGDVEQGQPALALQTELPLDSAMQVQAAARANQIYRELVQRRSEIGLRDFDDGVPTSIAPTHARITKEYREPFIRAVEQEADDAIARAKAGQRP